MNIRIQSPQAKATYLSVGFVIVLAAPLIVAVPAGPVAGIVCYMAFLSAWIVIGVRAFRGEDESTHAPRAWWRMTNKPTAGFVIAALLTIHAITSAIQLVHSTSGLIGLSIVFDILIAGLYAHSSLKLGALEHRREAATPRRED